MSRLLSDFFRKSALDLAPYLLGKIIVRVYDDGTVLRFSITEVEVYLGEADLACHASRGRTPRTEVMYASGGILYVYLIYGLYWMLNIVTGEENYPQALLIRGVTGVNGPGRVGKVLQLDKYFNAEDLSTSNRIWLENAPAVDKYQISPRVGIDYAPDEWRLKPWRFTLI